MKKIKRIGMLFLAFGTLMFSLTAFAGSGVQNISGRAAGADILNGTQTVTLTVSNVGSTGIVTGECSTYRYLRLYGTAYTNTNSGCGSYDSGKSVAIDSLSVSAHDNKPIIASTPAYVIAVADVNGTVNAAFRVNR